MPSPILIRTTAPAAAPSAAPVAAFADDVAVRLSYPAAPVRPRPEDYVVAAVAHVDGRPVRPTPVHYTVAVPASPDSAATPPTGRHITVAVQASPDSAPTRPPRRHITVAVPIDPYTPVRPASAGAWSPAVWPSSGVAVTTS